MHNFAENFEKIRKIQGNLVEIWFLTTDGCMGNPHAKHGYFLMNTVRDMAEQILLIKYYLFAWVSCYSK